MTTFSICNGLILSFPCVCRYLFLIAVNRTIIQADLVPESEDNLTTSLGNFHILKPGARANHISSCNDILLPESVSKLSKRFNVASLPISISLTYSAFAASIG